MGKKWEKCLKNVESSQKKRYGYQKYNKYAVCTKTVGRLNAKKHANIPPFFINQFGLLFGVYNKKKKTGFGLANPFKLTPFEALGIRKRPKKVTKGLILENIFTKR